MLAAMFLQEFAGDGPWAHFDMAGPGYLQRKRPDYILDEGGTGYGVRLIVELAQALASVNFDLAAEHELLRDTVRRFALERIAPVAEELDREKRFPYELVAELAELGLMGMTIPEEYGGAGSRHALVRDLRRGADADRLVGRDHRRRAPLARHAADLLLRQRGAEAAVAARPRVGHEARRVRADGAERRLRRRRDAHDRAARGRRVGDRRLEDLHHERRAPTSRACVTITALTGDDEISNLIVPNGTPGYAISAPMQKLGWRASDTRELVVPGRARAGGEPARPARRGLPPVPADPRRRPHLGCRDGRRAGAGLLRPRVRLRAGARAVREADREVPVGPGEARRHGDRDRGGPRCSSTRRRGRRTRAATSRRRPRWRSSTRASCRTAPRTGRCRSTAATGSWTSTPISRLYRDQKILEIGEGTNEVQRMVIAKHLGL